MVTAPQLIKRAAAHLQAAESERESGCKLARGWCDWCRAERSGVVLGSGSRRFLTCDSILLRPQASKAWPFGQERRWR